MRETATRRTRIGFILYQYPSQYCATNKRTRFRAASVVCLDLTPVSTARRNPGLCRSFQHVRFTCRTDRFMYRPRQQTGQYLYERHELAWTQTVHRECAQVTHRHDRTGNGHPLGSSRAFYPFDGTRATSRGLETEKCRMKHIFRPQASQPEKRIMQPPSCTKMMRRQSPRQRPQAPHQEKRSNPRHTYTHAHTHTHTYIHTHPRIHTHNAFAESYW
jgi:hypothetical protein